MFLDDHFLLTSSYGYTFYKKYAEKMPIIDYHCHLNAQTIYENQCYENLTQVWLNDHGVGDHYKWRLLRTNGTPEELVSGTGDDYEKFLAFVATIEKAMGNPIYEWSHLELRRYFGIDLPICQANALEIWERANQKLQSAEFRPQALLKKMQVEALCTTDDPLDSLEAHQKLAVESTLKVLPTFRPDRTWQLADAGFADYIKQLSFVSGVTITNFAQLKQALIQRLDYFQQVGCHLADQGLNQFIFEPATISELDELLTKALNGGYQFSEKERHQFSTALQLFFMGEYAQRNWTMQLHLNALRNGSPKLKRTIGADSGGDSIGDQVALTSQLAKLFAAAEENQQLPKTILYSLNANDWLPLATLMQSFQEAGFVQKLQLGCAWWFNDTCEGMRTQLTVMAQQSLLANFTGMLTDSRSFLSYPRHEYFRRVLCQLLGEWVEQGRLSADDPAVGQMIEAICYNNAKNYFGFFA